MNKQTLITRLVYFKKVTRLFTAASFLLCLGIVFCWIIPSLRARSLFRRENSWGGGINQQDIEEAGFSGYDNQIQVCSNEEDLPPSYARISYYPKVETEEETKYSQQPPPYRDSMRRGRNVNGDSIETISAAVHNKSFR